MVGLLQKYTTVLSIVHSEVSPGYTTFRELVILTCLGDLDDYRSISHISDNCRDRTRGIPS